jgi:hypothetical protein
MKRRGRELAGVEVRPPDRHIGRFPGAAQIKGHGRQPLQRRSGSIRR